MGEPASNGTETPTPGPNTRPTPRHARARHPLPRGCGSRARPAPRPHPPKAFFSARLPNPPARISAAGSLPTTPVAPRTARRRARSMGGPPPPAAAAHAPPWIRHRGGHSPGRPRSHVPEFPNPTKSGAFPLVAPPIESLGPLLPGGEGALTVERPSRLAWEPIHPRRALDHQAAGGQTPPDAPANAPHTQGYRRGKYSALARPTDPNRQDGVPPAARYPTVAPRRFAFSLIEEKIEEKKFTILFVTISHPTRGLLLQAKPCVSDETRP